MLDAGGEDGTRRARLAHEAVLRSWKRARDVVSENARFFQVRAELSDAFSRRQGEKTNERLLPAGTPLAAAEALVASHGGELPEDWRAYVKASRRRANRARHIAYGVAAGMAVLFVASAVAGVFAWRSEQRAALERDTALVAQSRHIATQARQVSLQGDVGTALALALALEALPGSIAQPDRPFDALAEAALLEQTLHLRERRILTDHKESVTAASFSPDGTRVVTSSWDRTARIRDVATGKQLKVLEGHKMPLGSVAFSADGKRVVTASFDGMAAIWDAASGEALMGLRGHGNFVTGAAFSPDSSKVATVSWDKTVRVWDSATGRELLKIDTQATLFAIAFSPDGKRLASASNDRTVRLLELDTGKVTVTVARGDRASTDGTARLWDAATGRERTQLRAHAGFVNGVAFSADGRWIATSGVDALALLWPYLQGQELLDCACSLMPRPLNRAQRELHFLDPAPKAPRCGRAPLP